MLGIARVSGSLDLLVSDLLVFGLRSEDRSLSSASVERLRLELRVVTCVEMSFLSLL